MGDFNFKIWAKKWLFGFAGIGVSAGLIWTADYINLSTLPPEYAFWGGLAAVICLQIGNMIKHSFLTEP